MTSNLIQKLCENAWNRVPLKIQPLQESGSRRRYFRVFLEDTTYIACFSENIQENVTFISLTRYLQSRVVKVPEILAVSADSKAYILQDLGDSDLLSILTRRESFSDIRGLLEKVIKGLVEFQTLPKGEWERIVEFPPLDSGLINNDFEYAITNLILPLNVPFDEESIRLDFRKLEHRLLDYPLPLWGLMFRDFQSRNIMVYHKIPYFIDYQSSRYGPGIYDIVSFAWQAKAGFSNKERERIITLYGDSLEIHHPGSLQTVLDSFSYWAMFRIIQTLGAYGLRGLKEGKKHFIESIPLAVNNLIEILDVYGLSVEYPEIYRVMLSLKTFL